MFELTFKRPGASHLCSRCGNTRQPSAVSTSAAGQGMASEPQLCRSPQALDRLELGFFGIEAGTSCCAILNFTMATRPGARHAVGLDSLEGERSQDGPPSGASALRGRQETLWAGALVLRAGYVDFLDGPRHVQSDFSLDRQ